MTDRIIDDRNIELLVRAFETCELNPADFKHSQHLAVALWYVVKLPFAEASEKMRAGIKKLASAHGASGYHETITLFWLATVRDFCAGAAATESITSLANRLAANCDKDDIYEFYSRALLSSAEAKREWVAPDLKPMPAQV